MIDDTAPAGLPSAPAPSPAYARWVLTVLVAVYVLNFIDRQIISILAEDIKHDLHVDDAYLGFLFGTAFGVFYALFGIPLGRLADGWHRVRLMSLGLALWSTMTALSGFARSSAALATARFGVGIGEATAGPCAYSLISDYFPKNRRATALSIYTAGLYLGAGLSLFIGGTIVQRWNIAFPHGGPIGLVGWQAAYLAVGIPGLLLALVVSTLKEPLRGAIDGLATPPSPRAFADFRETLVTIIPPFTLIGAARRGAKALMLNLLVAVTAAAGAYALIALTHSMAQWVAVGLGAYAVASWAIALKHQDAATYALTWKTPAFVYAALGYGLLTIIGYGISAWTAPYAIRILHLPKENVGLILGGGSAAAGFMGAIFGGRAADALRERYANGRLVMTMFGLLTPLIPLWIAFHTINIPLFYGLCWLIQFLTSAALGPTAATIQELVLPRMRGTAAAMFLIATSLIGISLGPYAVGYLSKVTGDLQGAILSLLWIVPLSAIATFAAWRAYPAAEASIRARAIAAGEKL